jgi:predicted transcriptional regulator
LSTERSHARKTWIQEKAQNHALSAFPNINNNQRSGKKRRKKTQKQKKRTKKRIGQECH